MPTEYAFAAEACEALSIDRSTLTRWVTSGRIKPADKAPGLRGPYMFTRDEVQRVKDERDATRAAS